MTSFRPADSIFGDLSHAAKFNRMTKSQHRKHRVATDLTVSWVKADRGCKQHDGKVISFNTDRQSGRWSVLVDTTERWWTSTRTEKVDDGQSWSTRRKGDEQQHGQRKWTMVSPWSTRRKSDELQHGQRKWTIVSPGQHDGNVINVNTDRESGRWSVLVITTEKWWTSTRTEKVDDGQSWSSRRKGDQFQHGQKKWTMVSPGHHDGKVMNVNTDRESGRWSVLVNTTERWWTSTRTEQVDDGQSWSTRRKGDELQHGQRKWTMVTSLASWSSRAYMRLVVLAYHLHQSLLHDHVYNFNAQDLSVIHTWPKKLYIKTTAVSSNQKAFF